MAVPPSVDVQRICSSPDFAAFVDRVKREFSVSIVPNVKMYSHDLGAESPADFSFKFRCQRSNSDFLITSREMLEAFLMNHNVHIYPPLTVHTHKRGDSFAEAFPHFDSKVLSTARTRGESCFACVRIGDCIYPFFVRVESTDLSRPSELSGDRRLRLANSSPDVKALFNAPTYVNHYLDEPEDPQANYTPVQSLDYWTPLPPIVSSASPLRSSLLLIPRCTQGSGIPNRTRHGDGLKRGSDSLLEAKMKEQISKPRTLQNRAQSLDLTSSLSRITESSSRLPPPESPTTSTGDTGGNSSPTSVTAPSFPSVYGPPMSGRSAVVGTPAQRSGRVIDDEAINEVSRVISNLGL